MRSFFCSASSALVSPTDLDLWYNSLILSISTLCMYYTQWSYVCKHRNIFVSRCNQSLSYCWLYLILCENLLCNGFRSFNTIHCCRSDSSGITCSFSTWEKSFDITFKLLISFHAKRGRCSCFYT